MSLRPVERSKDTRGCGRWKRRMRASSGDGRPILDDRMLSYLALKELVRPTV
jgi:hypothetical protein